METARKARPAAETKSGAPVAIDRRRSVPPQVYELLREKILTIELKPGDKINERWLADWLGVSRTPIREAINRLSASGLIAIVANVGTSVSLINVAKVKECYLIRIALESMIVRFAAERFNEADARVLSDLVERQIATHEGPDIIGNIIVDTEFHHAIARVSGLNATWSVMQLAMDEILRVRHLSVRRPRALRGAIDEHLVILDALKTRDPDRSEQAMKEHLKASYQHIVTALEEHPDYLEGHA
jgi:DNA-binding GntR family transcriptional regulator